MSYPPHDASPRWGEVGIHGIHRPREWDAAVLVDASDLGGDEELFVVLAGGVVVADTDVDVSPFVGALTNRLSSPYRARAVRQDGSRWAVAARRIDVVELPPDVSGDELELTVHEGEATLRVDGMPSFGRVPELERLGSSRADSYVVYASRLAGRSFDVSVILL